MKARPRELASWTLLTIGIAAALATSAPNWSRTWVSQHTASLGSGERMCLLVRTGIRDAVVPQSNSLRLMVSAEANRPASDVTLSLLPPDVPYGSEPSVVAFHDDRFLTANVEAEVYETFRVCPADEACELPFHVGLAVAGVPVAIDLELQLYVGGRTTYEPKRGDASIVITEAPVEDCTW
jgi:hypothetical protein